MNFPERQSAIGQMINGYLRNQVETDDRAIHLLFVANRWEHREEILRTLRAGTHIVMDRYSFSGTAFSSAKGLDREWCFAPERGLPAPDTVVYLTLTPEEAQQRGDYGEERYEKVELQRRVGEQFEALRQAHSRPDSEWKVVRAAQGMDEVAAEIAAIADATIGAVGDRPLATL
jgi:dTMP kinase